MAESYSDDPKARERISLSVLPEPHRRLREAYETAQRHDPRLSLSEFVERLMLIGLEHLGDAPGDGVEAEVA